MASCLALLLYGKLGCGQLSHSLFCLLLPLVRVKLHFRKNPIIIRTMELSCGNLSSLQLKPSLYASAVSYAAVRLTNMAPDFLFLALRNPRCFVLTKPFDTRLSFFVCSLESIRWFDFV